MGCFVFERVDDLFQFFRGGCAKTQYGYWGEKKVAGNASEWDIDAFKVGVNNTLEEWIICVKEQGYSDDVIQAEKERVADEFDGIESEWDAYRAIAEWDMDHDGVDFEDFFEQGFTKATSNYIWCCHAIVWAIAEYDKGKV